MPPDRRGSGARNRLPSKQQGIRDHRAGGIVINPAAFTHTSVAILDALATCEFPIIEVHISNVHKREEFRRHSYVSGVASGVIAGFGTQGYPLALLRVARLIDDRKHELG
jgi:3-dehydroquinate dehydratase-2